MLSCPDNNNIQVVLFYIIVNIFHTQIEKLEDVAATLEQLWISYNQIASLDGINCCTQLTTLYISNNLIKAWNELDKLAGLANLRDVVFVGNPIYDEMPRDQARLEIIRRLPQVAKIDDEMVKPMEREAAIGAEATTTV